MNYQFARNACSVVLVPVLLVLASGCSTQQVATSSAPLTQPSTAAAESKTIEPSSAIEPNALDNGGTPENGGIPADTENL